MQRLRHSRPSPALVIAIAALVAALAGTAVAQEATISAKTVTKKKAKNIARKQINKLAPGLSVDHANTADNANPTGPAGGDLTGEYPDPLIGNLRVSEQKIAPNAVSNTKIANDAVDGPKIAADAVDSSEIASAAVRADELGPTQLAVNTVNIAANGNAVAAVACPGGTQVVSGGGTASSFGVHMVTSFQAGNGWIVAYQNTTAVQRTITAIATCLSG